MNELNPRLFDPNGPVPADAGIFGLDVAPSDAAVVLIPVPFDATTSYGLGTCDGPASIVAASHQLDFVDFALGRPYEAGIAMLPVPPQVAEWNTEARKLVAAARTLNPSAEHDTLCHQVDALGDWLNKLVANETRTWLDTGHVVGIVGGDHTVPFAAIKAHAERYPGLGVLHIDAHADLRQAYEGFHWSHASIMYNVLHETSVRKLVQVGVRDLCETEVGVIEGSGGRVSTFYDQALAADDFAGTPWKETAKRIVDTLPEQVYVSFDIDGLDPSLCPHTGAPVPGGLSFQQVNHLLGTVSATGRRIVGFDLCEVAPGPDGDEWDANVGARILYKLCGYSLLGRER